MLKTTISSRHISWLLLFFIVLVGAALRLYGLDNQSLWNDELSSWARSHYATLAEVIEHGARPDVHPPGYHALVYVVERYLGDSETLLRLPSAIAGILTIPAIFLLGRRIYSSREGLIAAALVATLWWPLYYSQEGRAYALLMLFAVLSSYFWLEVVLRVRTQWQRSIFAAIGYVVTAIIACYLHYFGLLLVALQGFTALLLLLTLPSKRRALLLFVAVYALVLLAYLPWLPIMAEQILGPAESDVAVLPSEAAQSSEPPPRTGGHIPEPTLTFFVAYLRDLYNTSRLLLLIALALYGFLIFQGLLTWWRAKRIDARRVLLSPTFLLFLWLIVPYLLTYLVSVTFQPILTRRNLIISTPAAYLLLARAITSLPLGGIVGGMGHAFITAAIVTLSLYQILFKTHYYTEPYKAQFREAVAYVVQHDHLYDNSLIIGYAHSSAYFNYYFRKMDAEQSVTMIAGQEADIPAVREMLAAQQPDYLWYISASRTPDAEFVEFLDDSLMLIEHEALVDANVWIFESR